MEMTEEENSKALNDNKGHYSIQLASKISGVGVHTIRAWEKRYQAVVPGRNHSGRREYSDLDIERLSLLSELCTLGHSIGKIASLPTDELKSQLVKLGKQSDGGIASHEVAKDKFLKSGAPVNLNESMNTLFAALEEYKIDTISEEFNRLKLILNPRDLALKVISPLLKELELGVESGKFNIAQENALLALIKFHIGHILFRGNNLKSTRPYKVLLCSPEGSFNEFGILLGALLCSFYNLHFYYLGPNLPSESLLDSYRSLKANLIILDAKDGGRALKEGFMRSYAESVGHAISELEGSGHILLNQSKALSAMELESLRKVKNLSLLDNIESMDKYLKSL